MVQVRTTRVCGDFGNKVISRSQSSSEPSNSLSAPVMAVDPPPNPPQSSFTTAFSMLLYDVSYFDYTQTVDVPLSQAGDVLSNFWMVCCSAELGQ